MVAPLPVPPASDPGPADPASGHPAADPSSFPAVRLFADRAAAVLPDFELDAANAAPVAQICRTLDGMPLAIELAVPWLRTLTPAQLADRLDDRFALLTGGSRTSLPRHQTLRATVDWSWQLLSGPERALARRLAVFPGGATLTAAEQVCPDPAAEERPAPPASRRRRPAAPGRGPDRALRPGRQVDPDDDGAVRRRRPPVPDARDGPRLRPGAAGGGARGDHRQGRVRAVLLRAGRDRRPAAAHRRPDALVPPALGRAGQPARRAALGGRPRRRRHGAAPRPGPRLLLGAARARRGGRAGPRGARADAARPADQGDGRGAGDLRDAGGRLVLRPRVGQAAAHRRRRRDRRLVGRPRRPASAAAMAEPLLLQFTGGREQVQEVYDRYATAATRGCGPWGCSTARSTPARWGASTASRQSSGSRCASSGRSASGGGSPSCSRSWPT